LRAAAKRGHEKGRARKAFTESDRIGRKWYLAGMPRTARSTEGGGIYHVLSRGNGRMRIFHKAADYEAFERVLEEGLDRSARWSC
jgi:hypothetical protein